MKSLASRSQFRRYHSPLHVFAESFLERTRQVALAGMPGQQGHDSGEGGGGGSAVVSNTLQQRLAAVAAVAEEMAANDSVRGSNGVNSSTAAAAAAAANRHLFSNDQSVPKVKRFYKFNVFPSWSGTSWSWSVVRVTFDRLQLLAAIDRNLSAAENIFSIVLAVLVGLLAAAILDSGYYYDLWVFIFCLVTASCQYSLLKSVQPDSASPTHGFNRVIVFSRPVYFILW